VTSLPPYPARDAAPDTARQAAPLAAPDLARAINAALPQTQCTRCGYPDCAAYAQAVAVGEAQINQCPPGGDEGVARLAALTGRPVVPLNPVHGVAGPRLLAHIDEAWCIGCTLCLAACPTDAIVGANKHMHTVIDAACTGCELCLPVCPVDCIDMLPSPAGAATGWAAWSQPQADEARERYAFHQFRLARAHTDNEDRLIRKAETKLADLPAASRHTDPEVLANKRAVIEAALARARAKRAP
jgi:electron transport complex protein RnfB